MNSDKNDDPLWDAIHQIQATGKNSQNLIKKLFLHSAQHEIAIETLDKKIEANQQENRERFDQLECSTNERFEQLERSTNERFEQLERSTNERFDQLELLIRQSLPKN